MIKYLNGWWILAHACRYFPFRLVSDKTFLKNNYKAYMGKFLNIDSPVSFNEKLQWLKLNDRNPLYTELTDKYLVRNYVAKKIGEEYLIPLLGVWNTPSDIDYNRLPSKFVLKCNHDSGSVIICKDKKSFDTKEVNSKLLKAIKKQYYWKSREYNYKDINRKIIAEQYMNNGHEDELTDYKYFCFNGKPKFIQVDTGRFTKHIRNFYDTDWNYIDVSYGCKNDADFILPMPKEHGQMLKLAAILSEGIPHVRVDFYISSGKIYFGEMTFHHGGGFMIVTPDSYDKSWGSYIDTSKVYKY